MGKLGNPMQNLGFRGLWVAPNLGSGQTESLPAELTQFCIPSRISLLPLTVAVGIAVDLDVKLSRGLGKIQSAPTMAEPDTKLRNPSQRGKPRNQRRFLGTHAAVIPASVDFPAFSACPPLPLANSGVSDLARLANAFRSLAMHLTEQMASLCAMIARLAPADATRKIAHGTRLRRFPALIPRVFTALRSRFAHLRTEPSFGPVDTAACLWLRDDCPTNLTGLRQIFHDSPPDRSIPVLHNSSHVRIA